jgi:serine/threonine protein kinase
MSALPLNVVIGRYRIEKLVGSGGMGEVYRAINLQTRMSVAVKVLTETGGGDTALARFRNEAVIQYNLRHPNVAELYEYFEYQGKPCIVMEFVEGRTLAEWIREAGALEVGKALEILADICDAVSYMHSKGTIHRDIKSENIRVSAQGKAKLLDFGISVSRDTPTFTKVGCAIGTPEKMAPEQHQGSRGDARSDVWALGVLLYEMVTGAQPFSSSSPAGLRDDIVTGRYIPAAKRKPGLPKPIVRMISVCLRLKPDERYASSGVMLREVQQLRRSLTNKHWARRFMNPAFAAAGLALLVILLFFYGLISGPDAKGRGGKESPEPVVVPSASSSAPPTKGSIADRPQVPTPSGPQPIPSDPTSSATPDPSPPLPASGAPHAPVDANPGERKTVRVATYDGPAEVMNKDGQVLGSTPYPLTGPLGKSYELWLSRPGFQPRKVDVQINNKNEYLFGLEKIEGRPDPGKKE